MGSKYGGYTGKLLDIDLTAGSVGEYPLSDVDRERFLGGRYLSTKILWDELKPGTHPLSPENILVVMTSPLTGSGAPSSSRYDISAKSPLSGGIGHSNSGGNFGIHLKQAGWDGVVIRGKGDVPCYIDIDNDDIHLKSAEDIWGEDTEIAQEKLKNGRKRTGAMVIGPAGENLVKFACVVSQERVHGRTGMGAVMGSKNLKGIVVSGNQKISIFKREAFKKTVKRWVKLITNHAATGDTVPKLGTSMFVRHLQNKGALPTKNFSRGHYDDFEKISGETLAADRLLHNSGCSSCPIRCARVVEVDGRKVKGPEYEAMCLLGSNLLNNDMDCIIRWNLEMDRLGLDAVSTGTLLGFAAELNEKGLWNCGIEFGKTDNISDVIRKIAYREGIGEDLAEGVRHLSNKYGGREFAPHVKGLELPAYQPQAAVGHALGYATANRGGCHLDGGYMIYFEAGGPMTLDRFHYRSKPAWVVYDQDLLAAISAGGNCLFTAWTFVPNIAFKLPDHKIMDAIVTALLTYSWFLIKWILRMPPWMMNYHLPTLPHSKAIKAATGLKMSMGHMMRVGATGYNMERLFNIREGITAAQDKLPKRFVEVPLFKKNRKSGVPLEKMIPEYYRIRGWDVNGMPTQKTLKKLRLEFVDLDQLGGPSDRQVSGGRTTP